MEVNLILVKLRGSKIELQDFNHNVYLQRKICISFYIKLFSYITLNFFFKLAMK